METLRSPVGPSLVLLVGAVGLWILGRWVRRPVVMTGLALFFVVLAGILWIDLRMQVIVPTFSRAWLPLFRTGANLQWVGDGWNWYVAGLVLLMGGIGILLDESAGGRGKGSGGGISGVNLAIMGAAVLFVSSGNLLTAVFTWVFLDMMILLRGVLRPAPVSVTSARWYSTARGLSLFGAVLLLMALLPAGPTGPDQALQGGSLPFETLLLLIAAGLLRSGVYPLHFWLLPDRGDHIEISERLFDHIIPVVTGMWLLGWTISLGGQPILQSTELLFFLLFSMLAAAFTAFVTRDSVSHTTFVCIAAAGQAILAGALFYSDNNPSAMLWPVTTFALGATLWLVGQRIWQAWGWQLPVSVGALALAGAPFTPGFLMQPSFASLLGDGGLSTFYFLVYVTAQGLLIAALLRTWGQSESAPMNLAPATVGRLLVAAVALAIPMALAGFLPQVVSAMASLPGAIPPTLGRPPSVVAAPVVWIPLLMSLALGIFLVWIAPRAPARVTETMGQVGSFLRLDWLFQSTSWGMGQLSAWWGEGFAVVEGAGYMGWMVALILLAYLLIR